MDDLIHPQDFLAQATRWREAATKRTASNWCDIYLSLAEAYEQAAWQAKKSGPPMFENGKANRPAAPFGRAIPQGELRADRSLAGTQPPSSWVERARSA